MRINLKRLRIDKGYTTKQIAEITQISRSFYYGIESGDRNPSIKLAKKLEIILNTPMEQLFPDIFEGIS